MTDLEQFKALMLKANADIDILFRSQPRGWEYDGKTIELMGYIPARNVTTIVRVHHGYRCHYEAAFAADGSIIETGQFEEM